MSLAVRPVESDAERAAVYAFRYRVYVEELTMTTEADHERRWLNDDLDPHAVSFVVADDGDILGSLRLLFLDDVPAPAALVAKFGMQPAIDAFGTGAICTTSRFILDRRLRHGKIIFRLMQAAYEAARRRGARLNYGDCSPHLLPFYEHLGYRRYASGYNDTAYGYKVPILMLIGDRAQFARVRSPLARLAAAGDDDAAARSWFAERYPDYLGLESTGAVDEGVYFDLLAARVAEDRLHRVNLLRGLERAEAAHFLQGAPALRLRPGDRIVRKGDRDDTLYVLLSGLAEVLAGEPGRPPLFVLGPGDTFGEIAFLTAVPRTADVVARVESEVLVLSAEAMDRFIRAEPRIGARILLNLSRELAARLAFANQRSETADPGTEAQRA